MRAVLDVILYALDIYWFIIIFAAIMSWLLAFNVINSRNEFVRALWRGIEAVTEPVLRPIRRMLPNLGGIDISPIVVLLVILLIKQIIYHYIYPNVF